MQYNIDDADEKTVRRFLEFVYSGDFWHPEITEEETLEVVKDRQQV